MAKPVKQDKKSPPKPKTDDNKKSGTVTQLDDLELKKVTGGGYYDTGNV